MRLPPKGKFTVKGVQAVAVARKGKDMSADSAASSASLRRQIPSFVAVGVFGYFVDASVTYGLVRGFGVDPFLARFPAFALATIVNFSLNRALTFSHSKAPLVEAFVRYVMVCAAGLAVNYSAYAACLAASDLLGFARAAAMLPLYVAFGSGVAMFLTYFGFRIFAFRV
jgi:putative flippase GtrA